MKDWRRGEERVKDDSRRLACITERMLILSSEIDVVEKRSEELRES